MFETLTNLTNIVKQYEFLLGIVGVSVVGLFALIFKQFLNVLFIGFKRAFTCILEITNDDEFYDNFVIWFYKSRNTKYSNSLKIVSYWSGYLIPAITFGPGNHLFFYKKKPIIIQLVSEHNAGNYRKIYSFKLIKFGISKKLFQDLVDYIHQQEIVSKEGGVIIRTFSGGDWRKTAKDPRDIESIFMPQKQKDKIVKDFEYFFSDDAKAKYLKLGIPYRRGYLFYGPPGTGKSSFVHAIASKLNKPIYYINLNSIMSDNELLEAFQTVERNAIILIEDVDASILEKRNIPINNNVNNNKIKENSNSENGIQKTNSGFGISLSGLLNIIDSVIAPDSRLLILTTNNISSLDPALLRPGRIDLAELIDYLSEPEITNMIKYYFPNISNNIKIPNGFKIAGCELQNMLIKNLDDYEGFKKDFLKIFNI